MNLNTRFIICLIFYGKFSTPYILFFAVYYTTSISGSLSNVCGYFLVLFVMPLDFGYFAGEVEKQ